MILDSGIIAIFITLLISIVGVSFGYGILTSKVSSNRLEIEAIKKRYDIIDRKLDEVRLMVSRIEGKLNKE